MLGGVHVQIRRYADLSVVLNDGRVSCSPLHSHTSTSTIKPLNYDEPDHHHHHQTAKAPPSACTTITSYSAGEVVGFGHEAMVVIGVSTLARLVG